MLKVQAGAGQGTGRIPSTAASERPFSPPSSPPPPHFRAHRGPDAHKHSGKGPQLAGTSPPPWASHPSRQGESRQPGAGRGGLRGGGGGLIQAADTHICFPSSRAGPTSKAGRWGAGRPATERRGGARGAAGHPPGRARCPRPLAEHHFAVSSSSSPPPGPPLRRPAEAQGAAPGGSSLP